MPPSCNMPKTKTRKRPKRREIQCIIPNQCRETSKGRNFSPCKEQARWREKQSFVIKRRSSGSHVCIISQQQNLLYLAMAVGILSILS